MKKISSFRRAFTLVELLVVISIIALLSSIVLASLKNARSRSKDSKKLQELIQLRTALELYRSVNNSYPVIPASGFEVSGNCSLSSYLTGYYESPDDWIPGLAPKFYSKLPGANSVYIPGSKGRGSECYVYYSNGTDYKLTLVGGLEVTCPNGDTSGLCGNNISSNTGREYSATIYSPGAQSFQVPFLTGF